MIKQFSWRCPFCEQVATIQPHDVHEGFTTLEIKNTIARVSLYWRFVVCPNADCKKFTLDAILAPSYWSDHANREHLNMIKPLKCWTLIPPSGANVLPEYVPEAIVSDYKEACAIKELSPKASATLARRCLQGMIRDFWDITERRLYDEIQALEDKVDAMTWRAIDAVRQTGNIGAHMEDDINTIIDVDPNEAGMLIRLIETLVDDWYVARHDREQRLQKVIDLAQAKQEQRKPGPAAQD